MKMINQTISSREVRINLFVGYLGLGVGRWKKEDERKVEKLWCAALLGR
jgi:hypothetical protein